MSLTFEETAHVVGHDRARGHELQVLVPAGVWQSATPAANEWSLVACVVVPGFDYADFEMR
jgi:predicted cupin superfamily sugar epimerase